MEHVIVGAGIAGTSAADEIRKLDPKARITLLSEEPYPLYSRILLPEYLAGAIDESRLFIRNLAWYEERQITLLTSHPVQEVDPRERVVHTTSNRAFPYQRLLLATGGISFIPPLTGSHLPGVFALRTLDGAKALMDRARDHRQTVIIGGGVLGLEAGYGLLRSGSDVTVVEFFPRLLPRQMDVEGAAFLQRKLEGAGFRFVLGARSKEVVGAGQVEGLVLEDGTRLDCSTILISAGVRPNRRLADQLGLTVDKGVPVNDRLETGLPDIYAAGDLVEHRGVYYGLWAAAQKQGEVAGINMAGGQALYNGTTISNQLKITGVDLVAAGDIDPEKQADCIVVQDASSSVYKKMVIRDGRIVGTILYGDVSDRGKILRAIESGRSVSEFRHQLSRWDLSQL